MQRRDVYLYLVGVKSKQNKPATFIARNESIMPKTEKSRVSNIDIIEKYKILKIPEIV